jgi:outer membrane lipopolysaccharide assembly protein LptE/RlpB
MRQAALLTVLIAMAGLSAGGCGYRLAGRNQLLPESVKTIAIPPFENRTRRPEIEQRITEQVTLTFIKRGGYKTTASELDSDAVLRGAVTGYNSTPVSIDADGRATRYEIVITAEVQLRTVPQNTVLFRAGQFIFKRQYNVDQDARGFFDQEIVAIDLVARDFAEAVVTSILEGF